MEKENKMRWRLSVAIKALIVSTIIFISVFSYKLYRLTESLNELASSLALDVYFIKKDIDAGQYDNANTKAENSLRVASKLKSEKSFRGSYWEIFDYYVSGVKK